MLLEALGGHAAGPDAAPPRERLYWNRVVLYVWPLLDLSDEDLNAIVAPATLPRPRAWASEGVTIGPGARPGSRAARGGGARSRSPPAAPIVVRRGAPEHGPIAPLTEYEQKVVRLRQRGLIYPYEIIRMLAPGRDAAGGQFPPGDFVEYDLDATTASCRSSARSGQNKANVVVGVIRNFTAQAPRGHDAGDAARRSEPRDGRAGRARVPAHHRRARPGRASWAARSTGSPSPPGAKIAMDSGTENLDWIARVLRRMVEFTQAGGEVNVVVDGHQRRRPVLLERRGHDADAHQGHPGHDPGGCDGAHRQARARLLGRRLGRRQPGHRRLRAHHGAERPGAVLRPRHRARRVTSSSATTSTPTSRRASASRAARRPPIRRPRRAPDPHRRSDGARLRRRSATSSADEEPRAQEALRHPLGDARVVDQDHAPLERWLGDARRRDRGDLGRAPRRHPGVPRRHRVRAAAALRRRRRRRPGALDGGHALPAVARRRSRAPSTPRAAIGRW